MSGTGEARGKGGEGAEHFGRGRGGQAGRVEKVYLLFFLCSRVVWCEMMVGCLGPDFVQV